MAATTSSRHRKPGRHRKPLSGWQYALDLLVTFLIYAHGAFAYTRASMRRRRRGASHRAQVLLLVIGTVIFLALLIGSLEPDAEDVAFGTCLAATLLSIGLAALLRGERARVRAGKLPVAESYMPALHCAQEGAQIDPQHRPVRVLAIP